MCVQLETTSRDVFLGHFFAQQAIAAFLRSFRSTCAQLLFQLGNAAVLQFARLRQLAATLRPLQFGARLIEFFLQLPLFVDDRLFFLPFRFQRGRFFLQLRQFLLEFLQPFLARRDLFLS